MKILAIRGRNLASLARDFEVDLAGGELAGSGIFAICGPVGAGKTTLLDALCLALFDRTPRLAGRGGVPIGEEGKPESEWLQSHDPRTLLRRGAGEGMAEVDFTGRDGVRYRAQWTVRRARRRADGRMQGQEMALFDLDKDITVTAASKTEVLAAIGARLGLDFAQFCRSVLLAQGEFAAFLRASPDERASLLESLTGEDIYRQLSKAAHQRRKEKKVEIDRLSSQAEAFDLLTEEVRKSLEVQAARLAEELRMSQLATEIAQGYVSWYSSAAKLREEESAATVALQTARAASETASPRRQRLADLLRALPIAARAEVVMERQRAVVEAIALRTAADRELTAAQEALERQRQLQQAKLAAVWQVHGDVAPPLVVDHPRWQAALVRWSRANKQWQALGTTVAEVETQVAAAERAAAAGEVALRAAQLAVEAAEFRDLGAVRRQLSVERASLRELSERLRAWQQSAAEFAKATAEVAERERERTALADGFEQLVAARANAERELLEHRRRLDHLRARVDIAAFREHLIAGEPCPLCGSHEHPAPAQGDNSDVQAATVVAVAAEATCDKAGDAVRTREAQRKECERALVAARTACQRASADKDAARAAFALTGSDRTDAGQAPHGSQEGLAGARDRIAAREQDLARREVEHGERADRHEAVQKAADLAQQSERRTALACRVARERHQQCVASAAAVADSSAELMPALLGVPSWQAALGALGDSVLPRVQELADGEQRCQQAAALVVHGTSATQAATATVKRLEAELLAANTTFEAALAKAGLRAVDVREAMDLGAEALARQTEQLRELEVAVERARAVLQKCGEIRRNHEAENRPAIAESDASEALEDARAWRENRSKALEVVRGRLAADDLMRRQRDEIAPRLHAAQEAFAVWAALDDLIGHSNGDAFAVFAQGLTLDLLLIEANRRLGELAPRYQLHKNRGRDMDFVVVDLDLGGGRRSLQTLSGGEAFLVSLALALALATLAAPRSRVETLFLDEGFGTLDAHHLETALGALDSLQATGCQIGVISHVEGIAERIGAVVDVTPEGGGQSRIRVRIG